MPHLVSAYCKIIPEVQYVGLPEEAPAIGTTERRIQQPNKTMDQQIRQQRKQQQGVETNLGIFSPSSSMDSSSYSVDRTQLPSDSYVLF